MFVLMLCAVPFLLWGIINPQSQWWALSSWKYKNPEANEPSGSAYALTRFGNVIGLVTLVIAGGMFMRVDRHHGTVTTPTSTAPFVAPEPKNVRSVPIVDYSVQDRDGKSFLYVTFDFSESAGTGCSLIVEASGVGSERVTVNAHAQFAPKTRDESYLESLCGSSWTLLTSWRQLGETPPNVVVVTDGPLYNPQTKQTTAAAPGNIVPRKEVAKAGAKEPVPAASLTPSPPPR